MNVSTRDARKGYNGWGQTTYVTLPDGTVWHINTSKGSRAGVYTSAQRVTLENGMKTFEIYGDPNVMLVNDTSVKCTEKAVKAQHVIAVEVFKSQVAPNPPQTFDEGRALSRTITGR